MQASRLQAIIWDYDGTLVDTQCKNLAVTCKIVTQVTGKPADHFPALQSLENYIAVTKKATNWRDMYAAEYAMTPEQVDRAGWLWAEYQMQDATPVPLFDGIHDVLTALRDFPHGIVSQNGRANIFNALKAYGLEEYFTCIVGFEEVDIRRQKPEPDGLLHCIRRLTELPSGYVLYIGDHETDVRCAQNATRELQKEGNQIQVVSIGVRHGISKDRQQWDVYPDYIIHTPKELLQIVEELK